MLHLHLTTFLLGLAAVVLAANQALRDAPKVRAKVPGWVKSPKWNYAPLILVVAAVCVFGIKSINPTPLKPKQPSDSAGGTHAAAVPSPPLVVTGSGNALSFGQQGGMTVGTLNARPPNRVLDQVSENKLLSFLPPPSSVSSTSIQVLAGEGSDERNAFAKQIQQFLNGKGYKVASFIGWYMPLEDTPPGVTIYVSPSVPHSVTITVNANE